MIPDRETTWEERATWGTCPVCKAEHGTPCNPSVGIQLGRTINGDPPADGVQSRAHSERTASGAIGAGMTTLRERARELAATLEGMAATRKDELELAAILRLVAGAHESIASGEWTAPPLAACPRGWEGRRVLIIATEE